MKVIELHKSVTDSNDRDADRLRAEMKKAGVLLINLMSSPGSGKTTLLGATIKGMPDTRIAVLEADIDSAVDAEKIASWGARSVQVHTDGMCHMDAGMTREGLEGMGYEDVDLAVLENIGNLICPAEFDTGAGLNVMILSIMEGDDKPLKYPLMFTVSDVMLINKIDVAPIFDFDIERCKSYVRKLNPDMEFFPVSALKGEGLEEFENWLTDRIETWRNEA